MADDEKSKNQILQALDALSHRLYQKRTTSLALPRKADDDAAAGGVDAVPAEPRTLSRRLSMMSPFRSRSKHHKHGKDDDDDDDDDAVGGIDAVPEEPRNLSRRLSMMSAFRSRTNKNDKHVKDDDDEDDDDDDAGGVDVVPAERRPLSRRLSLMSSPFRSWSKHDKHGKDEDDDDDGSQSFASATPGAATAAEKKKGIWGWKPIRTLSHIGMQRVGCLFSVEVVAAQGLLPSMNGLRLAVAVRRKETRNGSLQTMPARVHKGAADFNEKLYVQCHLYCNGGDGATGKPLRFEPRPFLVSAVAMEAPELDFGQNAVDLSSLVKEFKEKCQQGFCPRQWNMTLPLAGKAKGGYLVVNLAFHIMDDGGLGLNNSQPDVAYKTTNSSSSSSFARKLSKSSFRIMSPKIERPPRRSPQSGTCHTLETLAAATAPLPSSPPCHRRSPAPEARGRAGMTAPGLFRRLGSRSGRI